MSDTVNVWNNKIIGHGEEAPDQLLASPWNWRIHSKAQQDALQGAIGEVGYIRSVTVNRVTGHVVDGHLRVLLALRSGQKSIPVEYVELSEDEEKVALTSLDPISAMASADKERLGSLLQEINVSEAGLQAMLAEMAEREGLYFGGNGDGQEPPEAQTDKAAELQEKWQVKAGDVWEIGNHRLICGDCADPLAIDRVMQGKVAQAMVTDPPYNVGFDYGESTNDSRATQEYRDWIATWFPLHSKISERQVLTVGKCNLSMWMLFFPGEVNVGAWVKGDAGTGRSKVVKFSGWEPILYYGVNYPRTRHTDCYEYSGQPPMFGHPCPKPLAMWVDLIESVSRVNEFVFDPFLGSGTTIVACERLGRLGRGVEIEPKYCAVSLQRLADMGLSPRLVSDVS